ncbi:MAG: 30S ribosomal protein S5 [Thaumarchaeota archaeon]|nr:30S ribosomal protein S5 [Nitrososphaerota archaeon]MBI3022571.1 30S ribosomal protein S5 [Nitrososphaerota archaeon]MBI3116369.1 30S ribosomal protein S5 [Nitrososphaerota archaeon]MCS4539167.1 30S ribosomal protein S5 [Nitrososphaerota archaeon]
MAQQAREERQEPWVPKTKLGKMVAEGKITSLEEIFQLGHKVREPEIVKTLLPDLKSEVVGVGIVQKQTDAGELTRFGSVVAVGNGDGWFGVGKGKAPQMKSSIDKATYDALLNIIPVKLGCGSWECRCGRRHSVPYRIKGKAGSVLVELIPGPRALGIVAGPALKNLLALAGVKDVWVRTFGSTNTMSSLANAVYDAFKKAHGLNV